MIFEEPPISKQIKISESSTYEISTTSNSYNP